MGFSFYSFLFMRSSLFMLCYLMCQNLWDFWEIKYLTFWKNEADYDIFLKKMRMISTFIAKCHLWDTVKVVWSPQNKCWWAVMSKKNKQKKSLHFAKNTNKFGEYSKNHFSSVFFALIILDQSAFVYVCLMITFELFFQYSRHFACYRQ